MVEGSAEGVAVGWEWAGPGLREVSGFPPGYPRGVVPGVGPPPEVEGGPSV